MSNTSLVNAINQPTITHSGIVYNEPLATIIMITLDRSELTERITRRNLAICGIPREHLQVIIIDNNSTEFDIIKFGSIADIHIANNVNLGVAKAQNMGLVRALGECVCLMGNDIEMPPNWLAKAMQVTTIPDVGLVGIDCLGKADGKHQLVGGVAVNGGDVFGTVVFSRIRILAKVGYLCNAYGIYGMEDSDYSMRIQQAGFTNYYLHGMTSNHAAPDVGQDTEYRRNKDASLQANAEVFNDMMQWYSERGVYLPAGNFGFDPVLGRYRVIEEHDSEV